MNPGSTCRLAAVQAAPVFLDAQATVDKTIEFIREAGEKGVDLIGFPEVWIPGYPWWLWTEHPLDGIPYVARYRQNALPASSPLLERIAAAARKHRVNVVVGFAEKDAGSLYIAQAIIARETGQIVTRRKLKPTHVERSLFGEGDGSDLRVQAMDVGRVGALSCWEHLQPLVKFAMYGQHEQIHVGSWPSCAMYPGKAYAFGPEVNAGSMRQYAVEGGCFVVSSFAVISAEMVQLLAKDPAKNALIEVGGGYSMIYGPDGSPLAKALAPAEEGLLVADIDLGMIEIAKSFTDPAGHYARPDVLRLHFNRARASVLEVERSSAAEPSAPQRHGPND